VLNKVGFAVEKPCGSFYCYAKAPVGAGKGLTFASAEACSEYLLSHAMISTVPWDDAGAYLRFSVTYEAETPAQQQFSMSTICCLKYYMIQ